MQDGWAPTPHRGQRKRGARCATKRTRYLLLGVRLVWAWAWNGSFHRCWGRTEKGQRYCVRCRRVHDELRRAGRAPTRPRRSRR